MARKAPRPCRFPGCPETTTSDDGYCPNHRKLVNQKFERTRETAVQRGYSTRWHKARKSFLNSHPLCEICLLSGTTTPAAVVDHIERHGGDYDKFWDENNWQALCDTCHRKKTVTQDNVFGIRHKEKEAVDDSGGLVY